MTGVDDRERDFSVPPGQHGQGRGECFGSNSKVHLMNTMKIEIYSDIICPWCYIGKLRMEAGLKLLGQEFNPRIVWRPFQLNPDMPLEGMNRKIYRTRKFGSWERSVTMDAELAATGKGLGIDFNYDKILMTPNTLAGHRLLWWAEQRNHQDALVEALFRAYFTEGRDVGRHDILSEIASEVGLPLAEARAFLDSEAGQKEVKEEESKGLKLGLQGVPFFVLNGVPAFSGAQMPDVFLEVFQQALAEDEPKCTLESC
jgi:predicted DsbA family dithiol-disulfide isomerase